MKTNDTLNVFYDNRHVGTLALTSSHKVAFQYSEEWLRNGFSISPFSLPLEKKVFVPSEGYFDGLFGVFADSLPDNWGRLLLSRLLKERNISMVQFRCWIGWPSWDLPEWELWSIVRK